MMLGGRVLPVVPTETELGHAAFRDLRDTIWQRLGGVPIRTKIMGIVLALVIILGVGVTWQTRQTLEAMLTDELELRAISIGNEFAAQSADYLLTNNLFALHRTAQETVDTYSDVRYVFVLDPKGRVVVHTFEDGFPIDLLTVHPDNLGASNHAVLVDSDEGPLLDVAAPILGGQSGIARVGLTRHRLEVAADAITVQLLLATGLVSLVGVAAALLLTILLTGPVLELVQVTRAIEEGNFARRARVWASDEIGRLALAINSMAGSLVRSRQELETSHALTLRRNRELTMLNAVAARLTESLDPNRLLVDALEEIVMQLGLRRGVAVRLDPATGKIAWRTKVLGMAETAVGGAADGPPASVRPFRVPLTSHKRDLGALLFWGGQGRAVPESDRPALLAAGQQIAVALENAYLWEELQRKEALRGQLLNKVITAQEDERKRIARELHDETAQALASVMVGLMLVEGQVKDGEIRDLIGSVRSNVGSTLDGVRQLSRDLRPSVLDDLGLVAALDRYVHDYGRGQPFGVDFHCAGVESLRLPPLIETALYRIAQEALTNAVRHARPTAVSVVLERRGEALLLIVEDDGKGFEVAEVTGRRPDRQLGLHGMRERAELLGATLTIESSPGAGTTVFVELPIGPEARAIGAPIQQRSAL